jgi:hypothetical protein
MGRAAQMLKDKIFWIFRPTFLQVIFILGLYN